MALVTFKADVFPYCKGDTVELSSKEAKRIAVVIEDRGIDTPYAKYVEPKQEKDEPTK